MTREEIIKILDRRTTIPDDNYSWEDINEAIEMAIEALEQPEIIRCKDCDEWQRGSDSSGVRCCSDEGFCCNWRVITGEEFYCGEAQKR